MKNKTTSFWIQYLLISLFLVFGMFLGGALVGLLLSRWVVPESIIVSVFGLLLLPACFSLAMGGWIGFAIFKIVLRLFFDTIRFRSWQKAIQKAQKIKSPPGKLVLLLIPIAICLSWGAIIGLISPYSWFLVTAGYGALGFGYGLILFLLGTFGHLDVMFSEFFI